MGQLAVKIRTQCEPKKVALSHDVFAFCFDSAFANADEIRQSIITAKRAYNRDGNPQVHLDLEISELLQHFEKLLDCRITRSAQNFYAHTKEDTKRIYVHADNFDWVAVSYFSHPPSRQPGVRFYRHLPSGICICPNEVERVFEKLASSESRPWEEASQHGYQEEKWEEIASIPYRFNRLILFPGHAYHRAASGWGENITDCRTAQSIGLKTKK